MGRDCDAWRPGGGCDSMEAKPGGGAGIDGVVVKEENDDDEDKDAIDDDDEVEA